MSVPTGESIYQLIPRVPPARVKNPRHKSKFTPGVKTEEKRNKQPSKTMGPAKVGLNPPQSFLKKHSKEPQLTGNSDFKFSDVRKPPVPGHTERPQMGAKSTRNFIATNAVNNILSVPRKPAPTYVDTEAGSKHQLEESGLVPKYINKREYGKVPGYLEQRRREMEAAQADYDAYVVESLREGQMEQVGVSERDSLLAGLKSNWDEIHHRYQGLSVVADTAPKKARKERMEAEMKQLERDIQLVEKHRVIYIAQDTPAY
ncbi:enkurin-like [Halichondria panicea]|uniref:enkurin-like n=1 Tax=Halichondria panicea TaxID=6063 RepID=UPI00312B30FF